MANHDLTVNQGDQPHVAAPPVDIRFERIVDFSVNNLASADTADLFDIPGYLKVIAASVIIVTPEGGTATIDLGIKGVDADNLLDGANINDTAGVQYQSGDGTNDNLLAADGYKVPAAGATVQLLANNALDTAKVVITVVCLDLRQSVDS